MSTPTDDPGSHSTIAIPPAVRERLGDRFSAVQEKYALLEQVGRGGSAVVYRARHRLLDTQVAVKFAFDSFPRERFLREARLMAQIDSPHVVALRDFELLPGGGAMLVMDYIPGGTLHGVIASASAPADEPTLRRWMREVAAGMSAAATLGIVHRDLKPANLLISPAGRVMVTDFGMARGPALPDESGATLSGMILGTPHYMAPEQVDDPHGVDSRADIYSFGATFYHAATGTLPFEGKSAIDVLLKHRMEPLVSPRSRREDLSEPSCEMIERCMAKSARDRFQTFDELSGALKEADAGRGAWNDRVEDAALSPLVDRYHRRRSCYVDANQRTAIDDSYQLGAGRVLRIVSGRLENQRCDALVSSDNSNLPMGGGVSEALRRAGGPELCAAAAAIAPVRPGRVGVTPGGRLGARYVFHAVTMGWDADGDAGETTLKRVMPSRDLINELVANCLYHADSHRIDSIAFPLLGSGSGGFPESVCLDTLFSALARALVRGATCVKEARIVLLTPEWKPLADLLGAMGDEPVPDEP